MPGFALLSRSRSAVASVRAELAELDVDVLSGAQVAEMLSVYAELGKLAAAGTTLAAGRAKATNAHEAAGARSATELLSATAGISSGAAERMLDLSDRLKDCSTTADLFRSGELSAAEAEEISRAATRDQRAEQGLIDAAKEGSFRNLHNRCKATQSPSPDEDRARAEAGRRKRCWRNWVDADGVGHFHAQGPADRIGLLASRLQARADVLFDAARASGQREPSGAYRFDALMNLVEGASGAEGTGAEGESGGRAKRPRRSGVPAVDLLIRIDFAALCKGYTEGDEICGIAGVGPIPVSVAAAYLGEATLKFVLTEGRDIRAVAHAGRGMRAHLRTALAWRYRTCSVSGCDNGLRLEYDHEPPFAKGGVTSFDNIRPKCHHCHAEKTRRDYPNGTAERRRGTGSEGGAGPPAREPSAQAP